MNFYKTLGLKNSRIDVADALRGLAVAGIILYHSVEHFNMYDGSISHAYTLGCDDWMADVLALLLSGKMYGIFALLFGLSFFIMNDNQQQRGNCFSGRFAWRMFLLAMLGIVNTAFFDGDILFSYAIYGLAEHYLATGNDESLKTAISLYHVLEEKGREPQYDGYVESFTENWEKLEQYDNNAPKTMNAHLHVLEAYTLLYQCWKDNGLKKRLEFCVDLFINRIYDPSRRHFNLFFDNEWNSLVEMDSYGHDVETGWLLCEAARTLENQDLIEQTNQLALDVTEACLAEGMSDKGYMIYEKKGDRKTKHASWWGQIETVIACVNAWQISGSDVYLQSVDTVWTFVKDHMVDKEYGEWYSDCFDGEPKKEAPKVSMWRCPYHTVRLGVEMYNRLK